MNPKVITIAQQKGGTGKTTLAVHLALAFIKYHNLKVAIIDTDPQGSLGKWFMIRSAINLKNGSLTPKERLVCNIINYMEIIKESWETSSFLDKNSNTLLIRYIDPMDRTVKQLDYIIYDVHIHNILNHENDKEQFEKDWNIIVDKIKEGDAHLLSEGDTKYLGACTKGSTAIKSLRNQPKSEIKAKQRAFSFKTQYMRELLNRL